MNDLLQWFLIAVLGIWTASMKVDMSRQSNLKQELRKFKERRSQEMSTLDQIKVRLTGIAGKRLSFERVEPQSAADGCCLRVRSMGRLICTVVCRADKGLLTVRDHQSHDSVVYHTKDVDKVAEFALFGV